MARVLHDILLEAAEARPDKAAVLIRDASMTYAEVLGEARRLAEVLMASGVKRVDRVGCFLEKRFEKVTSIFGISMAGGVFVPIRRLSTSAQAAHIVQDSGSQVVITTYSRLPVLAESLEDMPCLRLVLAIGSAEEGKGAQLPGVEVRDWSASLAGASGRPEVPRVVEPDLAAIMYTSGSTGSPKGVVFSHLNVVAGACTVSEYLKITEHDRLLSILTFGFDYGLNQLTTCFLKQASLVLLDYLFPKDITAAVNKYGVTGLAAVAATWIQLVPIEDFQEARMPTLRYVTNSGGAVPEEFVRAIRRKLPKVSVYLMYGLTEAFRSTFLDPELVDLYPTSMGKAIPGEEIMILDPQGRPVKPGEVGELVHRGVLVAQGYWNAPELTAKRYKRNPMQPAEVPIPEMAVFSGDKVRIDEKGFLYFVGRDDEMIKTAGNRVSPTEIEDLLYKSGFIRAAMALGVPHGKYGQSVYAVVVLGEGRVPDAKEILAHCKKVMPAYMVPAQIELRESLPRNANGKLDRALIRKQVYEKLGLAPK
ncbi:MAG TPA: acyl-CoA ligase (AMP-forming), exosortase A system-associated [Fibrobacteria bacterium]|nr:acyl-CoA ligase (AMP-forming), exosortase A system-associated [Fibrobacteria bacterium]